MADFFISYRRADSGYAAYILMSALRKIYGHPSVFMDLPGMVLGSDFTEQIKLEIERCKVVLVLIGDQWLDSENGHSSRRIDEPDDLVRTEIEIAIQVGAYIVPILVGTASLPSESQLPASIRQLTRLHAYELRLNHSLMLQLQELCVQLDQTRTKLLARDEAIRASRAPPPRAYDFDLSSLKRVSKGILLGVALLFAILILIGSRLP